VPHRLVKADYLVKNAPLIAIVGFGLLMAAALAVAFLVVRSNRADVLVNHTIRVESTAEALLSDLQSSESAKRGYLLTEESDYLTDFARSVATLPGLLDDLHELTADNPAQRTRLFALEPLISAKVTEMRRTLELDQKGEREQAIDIIRSTQGKKLVQTIRTELFGFLQTERDLLRARQASAAVLRRWMALLIGLALLSAAALAAVLVVATRHAVKGLLDRTRELEEESKLRVDAEETLRQAQKIEAVGQLTGGIAHDFNNLLTIIIGNLDNMKRQLGKASGEASAKLLKSLDAALQGAHSAGQLTQRLLAFSRRQALEPARLDVNRLVTGMLDMLRRTLGEQISIETVFGAGLWPTFADPHQLENVLLNLALNARAAMPEGGCLTIETANTYLDAAYARRFGDVEAGQYVVLCVTDTGTGIPEEILDKVFEPFFTTKPAGEGSGLGLAMVHGFVKQSGGHVRIYSEDGKGTTVKIYLPRMIAAEETATPAGKPEHAPAAPRAKPHEAILLVEDNEGVRQYAKDVLEDLGYWVHEAADAEQALRLVAKKPMINLLFTDVVLPGPLTGRDLATRLRQRYPDLPVLYTTGYTRNAIVHQGRLDLDVHLLNKPYTQQELAHKVRELLDRA
jgi:signal transduction histidine kinase/CheY-like chemotaxis protein